MQSIPPQACKITRIPREYREFFLLESEVLALESGIPLTIGIWNPSLTDMESTFRFKIQDSFGLERFASRCQQLFQYLLRQKEALKDKKSSTPTGLVWESNKASVSLFWENNMAAISLFWETNRKLKQRRFLATHVNRKWSFCNLGTCF